MSAQEKASYIDVQGGRGTAHIPFIPAELANLPRWLVWKGKKIPYYTNGNKRQGQTGSAADLQSLATANEAKEVLASGHYMGLGFAFIEADRLIGIDLDKTVQTEDGEENPLHRQIINTLASYTERSPSGNGYHIWLKLAEGEKWQGNINAARSGDGVEMYMHSRFFTFTGQRVGEATELRTVTEADLRFIRDEIVQRRSKQSTPSQSAEYQQRLPDASQYTSRVRAVIERNIHDEIAGCAEGARNTTANDAIISALRLAKGADIPLADAVQVIHAACRKAGLDEGEIAQLLRSDPSGAIAKAQKEGARYLQDRPAKVGREMSQDGEPADPPAPRFKLMSLDDILNQPLLTWTIKHVLPERGLTAVYGASGSGKSFLILSMAQAISAGEDWFGYRVPQPRDVVYLALEGAAGISQRVQALKNSGTSLVNDRWHFIAEGFDLTSDAFGLAAQLKSLHQPVLIIDTLNRAAPGRDENSPQDMSLIIQQAQRIADTTDGLVILVHHTGKDASKGARGHSSFYAALDAAILVDRNGDNRNWSMDKSKDGKDGHGKAFRLEPVKLGIDPDGEPLESCIVVADGEISTKREKPLSAGQQCALDAYDEAAMAGKGYYIDGKFAGVHLEDWRVFYYQLSTSEAKAKAFQRARKDLVERGIIEVSNDVYRMVKEDYRCLELTYPKSSGTTGQDTDKVETCPA